jgi:hypothetical protein
MANTIFSGARFRIPYYATTGTDLTSTGFVYYSPTAGTFTVNGTSDVFRGSAADLLTLGHYQSAAAANNSITITRSRGSATARTAVVAGDTIGNIRFNAVTNSSGNVALAGGMRLVVDTGTVSAGSLNSRFVFSTRRDTTEVTSLVITSETTSTSVSTGGVQIPQGGLGVNGAIYAGNIFTNGTRVSTFDGAYSSLSGKPTLFSGSYNDLTNKPTLFSGSYNDLTNKPTIPTNLDSLTDVIVTSPSSGQVLKYNGTNWVNDSDATGGGTTFSDIIKTSKGNTTPDFDFNGNGTADLSDVTNGYLKFANYGGAGGAPALTPYTWIEGSWAATTSSHGIIACVEGNAINALKKIVSLPRVPTGDTMFMGNVDNDQRSIAGAFVSGEQVGIFGFDNDGGQATKKTMSIVSTNDGSNAWNIEGDLVNVQGSLDVWGTFYPGPLGVALRSSQGDLSPKFDFDRNGTVELGDSSNGYLKMISSSKSVSSPPALTNFTWMEGTWATTTGSHAVISCVQGNSTNALKKVVDLPPIETGDTMFIGNLDQNQRASSGFYVHGEQVGMFAYDDNGGQNATTSTMSIRTTTDGSGRMELRASGGVRSFNTLTVTALAATGSTGFIQTKSYADTTARDTAIPTPVAGMIILAGTTFYGYNGSTWVALSV